MTLDYISDINFIGNNLANIIFSINSGKKYSFTKYEIIDPENNLNESNIKDLKQIISKNLTVHFPKKIK